MIANATVSAIRLRLHCVSSVLYIDSFFRSFFFVPLSFHHIFCCNATIHSPILANSSVISNLATHPIHHRRKLYYSHNHRRERKRRRKNNQHSCWWNIYNQSFTALTKSSMTNKTKFTIHSHHVLHLLVLLVLLWWWLLPMLPMVGIEPGRIHLAVGALAAPAQDAGAQRH